MDERHHIRRSKRTQLLEKIGDHKLRTGFTHRTDVQPQTEGKRVPRDIKFRHDGDPAFRGVGDYLLELLLRIVFPLLAQEGFGTLETRIFL